MPLVKAGISNFAPTILTVSSIKKTLSAKTISPGKSKLRSPDFSVKYLSLVLPPQAFDIYDIVPYGVIPIKNFIVS